MPLTLPNNVYLKYGAYTFRPESKTRLSITPVPDRAGRATKYTTYSFDVQTTIFADAPATNTSNEMVTKIAEILQQHGNRLTFQGFGFDLDVNNPKTNLRDITYGPHPKITSCVQLGQDQSWGVNWHCETSVTDMCSTVHKSGVLAYNFEWDVSIDNKGYSTRTISGQLEVAGYRQAAQNQPPPPAPTVLSQALSDNAEHGLLDYWDTLFKAIQPIDGFDRVHTSRHLSDDKRTLTFTIVDQEMPRNSFQKNIIEWSGTHEASTSMQSGGFYRATNTISATYKVARAAGKQEAAKRFQELVASRVSPVKSGGGFFKDITQTVLGGSNITIVPMASRVSESLHNEEVSFSYTYFRTTSIKDMLKACGFFTDIPNSDWKTWYDSIKGTAKSSRGNAQLYFSNDGDAIIDICSAKQPVIAAPAKKTTLKTLADIAMPKPDNSWVAYKSQARLETISRQAFHKILGNPGQASIKPDLQLPAGFSAPFQQGSTPPDVVQSPTASNNVLILTGGAMRAGYEINAPTLVSFGGVTPVLIGQKFINRKIADYGIPVFAASWLNIYRLPSAPGNGATVNAPPVVMLPDTNAIGAVAGAAAVASLIVK